MNRLRFIHTSLSVSLLGLTLFAAPASGQAAEGISVGITPSFERVFFHGDLLFDDATYFGGRLGLNWGRHVGLEGYYLTVDALSIDTIGGFDSYRAGGDIVLTFAERKFTPFARFGAGVMAFERSAKDEVLTATLGGGLRFDILNELQTQLFVQDLIFRVSDQSAFVDPSIADTIPDTRTFHNLTLGAGVNFYVGGEPRRTETDRFFEQGLRGVSVPLEVFAGEFQFSDDFGLEDETVVGARLGLEFGPYVGLHGYYFGGTGNDFNDFDEFYGYGLEGMFGLTPPNSSLTPFLILGTGRLHFTDAQMSSAGFTDDKKWTATLGAGVAINLDDRVKLEASARDILMSRDDPTDVTNPNQLKSSWLWSGGLKVALGGSRYRPAQPEPIYRPVPDEAAPEPAAVEPGTQPAEPGAAVTEDEPIAAEPGAAVTEPVAEGAAPVGAEDQPAPAIVGPPAGEVEAQATPAEESPEIIAMRERIAALEAELHALRDSSTQADPVPDRHIQIPAPELGELYVRWGQPGAFDRVREPSPAAEAAGQTTPAPAAVPPAGEPTAAVTPPTAELGPGVPPAGEEQALAEPRTEEYDELLSALASVSARLDAMEATQARADSARTARALADIEQRLSGLQPQPAQPTIIVPPTQAPETGVVVVDARQERGVFRGGGLRVDRIGIHTGFAFSDPEQLLLGMRLDMGSAFGGSVRFVPEATFGITGDNTFNLNTHIEWPLPFSVQTWKPFVGGGLGLLAGREDEQGNSDLELMIPNFVFGASYPVGRLELYGVFQALDLFDDNRIVVGLRLGPRLRTGPSGPSQTTVLPEPTPVTPDDGAGVAPQLTPELEAERERLEAERERLEAELVSIEGRIDEQRTLAEEEGLARERAFAEAEARAALEAARRDLLLRFQTLAVDVNSVTAVRQGDRGLFVELSGPNVFASGQATLSAQAQQDVRAIADALIAYPDLLIAVEGHTDATGTDAVNQPLSERRAESVRRALEAYGVASERITTAGFGEARPLVGNDTSAGRARNRRVEVIVLGLNR